MLKRIYRLPLRRPLLSPKVIHHQSIVLKILPNTFPYSRFGFVIAKRIVGSAVLRNKARRLFHTCIAERLSQIKPGYDMLFVFTKNPFSDNAPPLCDIIATILKKQGLLT